jgi:hypothetical protein
MSVFNFMETFFFISLGITFVLILLLVYHFKQRLTVVEQKGDTMFDIINNMVIELSSIKSLTVATSVHLQNSFVNRPVYGNNPSSIGETFSQINTNTYVHPESTAPEQNKDKDDEDEDEDEDDDEDSGSDPEDTSSPELSDSESESDSDDEKVVVSDDDDNDDEQVKEDIKIVNIPITESTIETDIVEELEDGEEIDSSEVELDDLQLLDSSEEPIVVNKLEQEPDLGESHGDVKKVEFDKENALEVYRKMNLNQLKTLVVSKGFVSDASKMKKPQLLQILETNLFEA